MSTEHPILFSTPMVRAILAGQKTVTRRVIRGVSPGADRPLAMCGAVSFSDTGRWVACPYGAPGDRLWVRETWRYESDGVAMYRADVRDELAHRAKWRPGIHLRREHARLCLAVEDVRVERLHAIDEADARAEGAHWADCGADQYGQPRPGWSMLHPHPGVYEECLHSARSAFANLWGKINSKRAPWDSNPWVWRVQFRRLP